VITGLGVLSPIGHGLAEFAEGLREGRSGIRYEPELESLGFGCCVAGVPCGVEGLAARYFEPHVQIGMDRYATIGCIAGLDCWKDAGLPEPAKDRVDWDTSIVFGSGIGGIETIGRTLVPETDNRRARRLGSTIPERIMGSSVSARLAGILGAGGQVTSNSSACATGTEAIANAWWMVREGRARRVIAGGCEGASPYIWAGFDAMRVLSSRFNDAPSRASRPMSASAGGFVPAGGGAALMLEDLDTALQRGARIYAEIAGGAVNCGGHRNGGTMTAANAEGARRCIRGAVDSAKIGADEIDLISGHLTATAADPMEAANWRAALNLPAEQFPLINAPKSLFGHTLGAAGAIESVACVLQLYRGFVHPSINCEDVHPELGWCERSIPRTAVERDLEIVAKASFGFGDVNACIVFRRWKN
jgi:3-oxoacyl-(acyl-carrier-protein) synthase